MLGAFHSAPEVLFRDPRLSDNGFHVQISDLTSVTVHSHYTPTTRLRPSRTATHFSCEVPAMGSWVKPKDWRTLRTVLQGNGRKGNAGSQTAGTRGSDSLNFRTVVASRTFTQNQMKT